MNSKSLVQPLFEGPIDIVGDVHGEIDALHSLLRHLGYDSDGSHPDDRRLVFVGDLTDRGPDSPAVVARVQSLIESGRAQCVLGNHEFNILVGHKKAENKWFWGDDFLDKDGSVVPQVLADDSTRQRVRTFFQTLPIALARDELRVVHAGWDDGAIGVAKDATDVISLFKHHAAVIDRKLAVSDLDDIDRGLIYQNRNPVQLLLSGPEERTDEPVKAGGKMRNERRVHWWNNFGNAFCVFGHYAIPNGKSRDNGWAFCLDYGVGHRWTERREGKTTGFSWRLAAMRFPERMVVFDDGREQRCTMAKILTGDDLPAIKEAIATFQNGLDAYF